MTVDRSTSKPVGSPSVRKARGASPVLPSPRELQVSVPRPRPLSLNSEIMSRSLTCSASLRRSGIKRKRRRIQPALALLSREGYCSGQGCRVRPQGLETERSSRSEQAGLQLPAGSVAIGDGAEDRLEKKIVASLCSDHALLLNLQPARKAGFAGDKYKMVVGLIEERTYHSEQRPHRSLDGYALRNGVFGLR